MRHVESPELFGGEMGSGTCGNIKCEFCGATYNEGNDASENYQGDSVTWTDFAGLTVCDCCFERVESEVLRRMPDILKWYRVIIERRRAELAKDVANLDTIRLERPVR